MESAVLGVDLGGTNVRVGRVEDGDLADITSAAITPEGSVREVLEQVYALIDRFDARAAGGIGVGVPSVVDAATGVVYDVQNIPSWKEVPLKALLEERYGVPTFINNDANCFALGEKHFGKGRGYENLVGLILGTGFAAGLVLGGRLYNGATCGAGEVGMIPYRDSIYEYYCGGQFFERRYGVRGKAAYRRAEAGEEAALAMFAAFGEHLGNGIKTVLYAYDPEVIILGGSVRKAYRFFEATMWEAIRSFAYTPTVERLRIEVSEREHIAVLGAAALVLEARDVS